MAASLYRSPQIYSRTGAGMSSFLSRCVGAVILVAATTGTSLASSDFVLATSKIRKAQLIAEGGEHWCGPTIRLKMILAADSPIRDNPTAWLDLANRLDTPIAAQCQKAEIAYLSVFEGDKALGSYQSSAAEAWRFSAAERPVDSGPARVQATIQSLEAFAVKDAPPLSSHVNYESLMVALVGRHQLMQSDSDDVMQCWAAYRWGGNVWLNAIKPVGPEETMKKALRDLLREAMSERAGADQSKPTKVTLLLKSELGPYDKEKGEFPVGYGHINAALTPKCDIPMKTLPAVLRVFAPDMGLVSGLPMDPKKAQSWREASQKGREGISVAYVIVLDPPSSPSFFNEEREEEGQIDGALESAVIYGGGEAMIPLYVMNRQEVEQRRQLESAAYAKRAEERDRKERQMQIQKLSAAPFSVRLANWFFDAGVNETLDLDTARSLYRSIIMEGEPVPAALLIKAGADGRENVAALWPAGLVKMTLGAGVENVSSLEKERWYLARGEASAVRGSQSPALSLEIAEIYACAQEECRELDDAEMIVDKKRSLNRDN